MLTVSLDFSVLDLDKPEDIAVAEAMTREYLANYTGTGPVPAYSTGSAVYFFALDLIGELSVWQVHWQRLCRARLYVLRNGQWEEDNVIGKWICDRQLPGTGSWLQRAWGSATSFKVEFPGAHLLGEFSPR